MILSARSSAGLEQQPSKLWVGGSNPSRQAILQILFCSLLIFLFLMIVCLVSGGRSSVGRAPDCDSGCRGFEPHRPPQKVFNR